MKLGQPPAPGPGVAGVPEAKPRLLRMEKYTKTGNPRAEEYKTKARALGKEQMQARLNLARWCVEKDLVDEAQVQLLAVAAIDPKNDQLLAGWAQVAEKAPCKQVVLRATLSDGNVIKGTCSPRPFLLRHKDGVLMVSLWNLKRIRLLGVVDKTPNVELETTEGTIQGLLTAPPLVIKTAVGELNVPFDKIERITIGEEEEPKAPEGTETPGEPGALEKPATPGEPKVAEVPENRKEPKAPAVGEAPREVVLDWNKHLEELRGKGLDVVFVFDSTGSMGGIILEVRQRIRQLATAVTRLVPGARLGLVTYRDIRKYDMDDYQYTVRSTPLTTADANGLARLEKFLRETEAFGGGDVPEAVYEGVQTAMEKAGWRADATKIIIVFGDAPPRPENNGVARLCQMCRLWHDRTGGIVSCIHTTGGNRLLPEFAQMAKAGGGEATTLLEERTIIKQLAVYIFGSRWEKELEKVWE